jgi:predicted TIM-barrel fold metal-dependent hydrolase
MTKRKIIDAHHHLWDLGRGYNHPWLQDKPGSDGMLGDLKLVARDYPLRDYCADTANYDVVGSVHIEAVAADPLVETRWLEETTIGEGLPSGVVAHVELHKPNAEKIIAEHLRFRKVRGVRHIVNWHPNPKYTFTDHDFLTDSAWLSTFRLLGKYGLSFDLQLYPGQMSYGAELARRNPETLIVVNHAGATKPASPFGATE